MKSKINGMLRQDQLDKGFRLKEETDHFIRLFKGTETIFMYTQSVAAPIIQAELDNYIDAKEVK